MGEHFVVDPQQPLALLHDALGIIRIINRKMARIAEALPVPPQDTRTGGVEGACPYILPLRAEHRLQPLLKLASGLIGKRNRKDLPRLCRADSQKVRNFIGIFPRAVAVFLQHPDILIRQGFRNLL